MMSRSVLRQIESDLLEKVELVAYYLSRLAKDDPNFAAKILETAVGVLEASVSQLPKTNYKEAYQTPAFLSKHSEADEIEGFILENLATAPLGLSVQGLFDRFLEAGLNIKRQTLVVRLHRMVHAGKLAVRAHGHYALSEVEDRRRQSS